MLGIIVNKQLKNDRFLCFILKYMCVLQQEFSTEFAISVSILNSSNSDKKLALTK